MYMSSAEEEEWEDEPFTAHTTPMHLKLPHTMKVGDIYIWSTPYNPLTSVKQLKIYASEHWVEKVQCVAFLRATLRKKKTADNIWGNS